MNGYLYETSAQPIPFSVAGNGRLNLTAEFLRELSTRAQRLLGENYAHLRASDIRGQTSRTPPASRHRLTELISHAEETASVLETRLAVAVGHPSLDDITELVATVEMFERWRNHPAWPQLVAGLASETEGPHSLMLLSAASYLSDQGNGVGIVHGKAHGRIPDLWLEPNLIERVDLEVKTPLAFRGSRTLDISAEKAEEVITKQVNKAASQRRGQLRSNRTGLLAIGAFHLPPTKLEMLATVTRHVLEAQTQRKRHLAGVLLCAFSYSISRSSTPPFIQQLKPGLQNRWVWHPGYRGNLAVGGEMPPRKTTLP
ncbi:MAG TPA: hypothetical protein VGM53_31890 [Streptosporangiaceae bacterium]|jgi:hypothetical protein